jgi:hypothetical protein
MKEAFKSKSRHAKEIGPVKVFSPGRKVSIQEVEIYGLPGAACPVFGSVGVAALAAMGFEASAP